MALFDAADKLAVVTELGGSTFTCTVGGSTVVGNFREQYVELYGTEGGVEGVRPTLTVVTSDVSSVAHQAAVVVDTVGYVVVATQPSDSGLTLLVLEAS